LSQKLSQNGCSNIISILGLWHAICWVHELQLINVDFELDAEKVIDYFNKGNNDIFEFETIVEECRRNCNFYFANSKVEFSRRPVNEVAHTLVREVTFSTNPHTFNDVLFVFQH